jgi:hypothetical protein
MRRSAGTLASTSFRTLTAGDHTSDARAGLVNPNKADSNVGVTK